MLPTTHLLWLKKIRNEVQFNPKEFIVKKSQLLNEYMSKNGLTGCVVSVSGGVDSAVTYLLALHAKSFPNSPIKKVLGISQPIHSTPEVYKRAFELPGEIITIDQSGMFNKLESITTNALGMKSDNYSNGQLKSYMRTPVNYYTAQLLSANGYPSVVLGTGNLDEDGYLCYFCKAGDGVVDLQLISDLHKSQVYLVAKELGVSENIINAPPTADLWESQTDESELGFPYDFIELLICLQNRGLESEFLKTLNEKEKEYYFTNKQKATEIHNKNKHKLVFPINL